MSRTKRGSKGAGWDYWSKRVRSKFTHWSIGKAAKKATGKAERKNDKEIVRQELEQEE